MSAKNGDKARYGRLRKAKLARRLRGVELKKSLTPPAVVETADKPAA